MRRLALLAVLAIAIAVPLRADRGQSYFTYDDGGTIVRQGEDNREVEVRVNLPVFPGDEVITNRRGRSEIRLSDGNVIALDRATDLRFRSILDSYDGNAAQTVVDLRYGHVIVQRTEYGHDYVRLDTDSASFIATNEAIYAIDSDSGHDRITVFEGTVEVRTPQRTVSVRAGEEARVDPDGLYGLVSQSHSTGDEFERWYLRRAERYGHTSSRYLGRSLAYADDDLGSNGSWTYVSGFSTWAWRPRVAVGWRPYFYGEWVQGIGGSLIWVSAEPWGWVPYHYGRWAYDSLYGWVWLPGTGYSPAWVYWMYGPGYIGWAPAGWWDCYRPYYEWSYRPYTHSGWDSYWGSGRIRAGDIDIRPWTFLNPTQIVGARADRAALSVDMVRERLRRTDAGGFATVSVSPARFTRGDMKDPVTAVNDIVKRGGIGGGAPAGDITPFIRRDADLSKSVRDRIVRSAPPESTRTGNGGIAPIGGGSIAPIGGGNDGRISRGEPGQGHANRGNATPSAPAATERGGVIRRGETPSDSGGANRGTVERGGNTAPSWRDSGGRGGGTVRRGDGSTPRNGSSTGSTNPATPAPSGRERVQRPSASPAPQPKHETPAASPSDSSWRGHPVRGGESPRATAPRDRGSDVPRRVIDRIGGARVYPSDGGRASAPPPRESPPPRVERPSSPPPSPPPQQHHDSGSSNKNSGSKDSGGHVHRNN